MNFLHIKAYAKLNLYLKILKKREDNYHELITIFERINLYDELIFKKRKDKRINIQANIKELPLGKDNLVYKAVELLRNDLDIDGGLDIEIKKSIPLASGLGGGSSDCAATLLALNRIWNLNLKFKDLLSYAKRLGADVAFFLYKCPFAIGKGKGDEIKPVFIKNKFWHILVLPKFKISTSFIYRKWDNLNNPQLTNREDNVKMILQGLRKRDLSLLEENLFNHLEIVSFKLYPLLIDIKEKLIKLGFKKILLSGSGPAMFGFVSSRKEGEKLCEQLRKDQKDFKILLVRTL